MKKWFKDWRGHLKTVYLLNAIVFICLGLTLAVIGHFGRNALLLFVGTMMLAGGFLFCYQWLSARDVKSYKKYEEGKPPNVFAVTPKTVEFIQVGNTQGLPWKCENNNVEYYVHEVNGDGHAEFTLPDADDKEIYFSPPEYANVITMPCNKKYFTWSMTTFQKVSVGLLALVIVGELIGLIAIGG